MCSGWDTQTVVNREDIHAALHLPGCMKAVCGYSQMQVLNASAVVVTSPLMFRYILFLSPNLFADLICVFFPLPYLLFFVLPFRSLFCLCLSASKGGWPFVLVSLEESRGTVLWCVL